MSPIPWHDLSESVRAAVIAHTGPVTAIVDADSGAHCDLAVTVEASSKRTFVKGIRTDQRAAWTVRNQINAGPHLPDTVTPPLRWHEETDGWLLAGFAHLTGRAPDLAPGSLDLPLLASALEGLAVALTPPPVEVARPLAWRWERLPGWRLLADDDQLIPELDAETRTLLPHLVDLEADAPRHLDGNTLAHTDPVPANFLLTDHGPRLIDWSFPGRAPAWADTAFLTIRLVDAGHPPQQADAWGRTVPAYAEAPPEALAAFTVAAAGLWTYRAHTTPTARQHELAAAARATMRHHLTTIETVSA